MNQIICSEALAILPTLPSDLFQVIVADPPYYNVLAQDWDRQWTDQNQYLDWCDAWLAQCMRLLREDGLCFVFGQLGKREHAFLHAMSRFALRHQFHDLIIWDRTVGYRERTDSLTPAYEMVFVLRKSDSVKFYKDRVRLPYDAKTIERYLRDKRYKNREARRSHLEAGKFARNILRVPSLRGSSHEKVGHPSQKPEALIKQLLLLSTDQGDGVLDPFLGSGTTAAVATELNRRWLGIERDPHYCQIAGQRLALGRVSTVAKANS